MRPTELSQFRGQAVLRCSARQSPGTLCCSVSVCPPAGLRLWSCGLCPNSFMRSPMRWVAEPWQCVLPRHTKQASAESLPVTGRNQPSVVCFIWPGDLFTCIASCGLRRPRPASSSWRSYFAARSWRSLSKRCTRCTECACRRSSVCAACQRSLEAWRIFGRIISPSRGFVLGPWSCNRG